MNVIYPTLIKYNPGRKAFVDDFYANKHSSRAYSVLLESLVRQILFRGHYNIQSFEKQLVPAFRCIFSIFTFEDIEIMANEIEDRKSCLVTYKYTSYLKDLEIETLQEMKNFLISKHAGQESVKKQLRPIHKWLQRVFLLLQNKNKLQQNIHSLQFAGQPQLINPLPIDSTDLLPLNLQCPLCKRLTNRLFSCLLCDWKGCEDDKNCIRDHTIGRHIDGSIFIYLFNGQIIYSYRDRIRVSESIYYNIIGEPMNHQKGYGKQRPQRYELKMEEFNNLKVVVAKHNIYSQAEKI